MKCALCEKEITDYNPELNRLELDETRGVGICQDCVDRFLKWQQELFARLFPTKASKRFITQQNRKKD